MSIMNRQQFEVMNNVHEHKKRAFLFKEKGKSMLLMMKEDIGKINEINRENMKILNKLVEISKGKLVRKIRIKS